MYQTILDKMTTTNTHNMAKQIKENMFGTTMHQHFHVLYDLADVIEKKCINYAEIGIYNCGSFSLVLGHPNIKNAVGIDPFVFPNQRMYAEQNISKYNVHNATVKLLPYYSTEQQCLTEFENISNQIGGIDLLFIDGDHRRPGVLFDFYHYYHYVNEGGYIVFDDYNDSTYSPEVLNAVDNLIEWIRNDQYHINCELEIIGALPNFSPEIHYVDKNISNEFIVRVVKKRDFPPNNFLKFKYPIQYLGIINSNIEFAIVIATYPRANGSTPNYIKRCLRSIDQQKYTKWKIYLVGDSYPENELHSFREYLSDENKHKLIIIQNTNSERNFIKNANKLWCVAGAESMNVGLTRAKCDNMLYYVHLDDDDYWEPEHLLLNAYVYNEYPNCIFTVCKSTYGNTFLPMTLVNEIRTNNIYPRPGGMIHSAFSFRCDIVPFNYFTTHDDDNVTNPSDFIMLNDINTFIQKNQSYSSIYIPFLTVHHDEERQSIN